MTGEKMHLEDYEDASVQFTSKSKSNTGSKAHIDMTPMVDVVFQLLTFFLLAVKRDSSERVDVPFTTNSTAVLESESTYITIKKEPGKADAIVVLGDRKGKGTEYPMTKAKNPEWEKRVLEAVQNGIKEGKPKIVVKAERLVKWGDVQAVTRIIAQAKDAVLFVGVQGIE